MIYLFDKHEQFQTIITSESLREAYYEEQLGGASVLRATLPKQDVVPVYVAHRDLVNTQTFLLYKVIRFSEDGDLLTIEAIESAYDDLKADGFVQDYRPNNQLLRIVSDNILDGSRWATGAVDTSKTITSSFYYQSRLESILSVMSMGLDIKFRVQITGTEITGRYVDWYDELGADRGKRYVHGGGLLKIDREEERSEIYTALIGRGKGIETYDENGEQTGYGRRTLFSDVVWSTGNGDPVDKPLGQAFVEIPERTAEYGYPNGKPRIGILELSDISDPIELLQETYNNLEIMSRPLVHYSADVRDEGTTGLGDTVAIIRGNIRYKTRIFKRTVDLLRPKHVKIELGDKIQSYTVRKLSDLTTKIERSAKEVRLTAFEQVKAYVDQSGGSYWSESGYNYDLEIGNEYGLPAGLYSFDTPIDEAYTKWIYFGAGKLIVSDTKNPDGTWQIKTILDGSGLGANIVGAEQVIAGSLLTDHIKLESGETLTQGLATFGDTLATHTTNITAQGLKVTSHEERLDGLDEAIDSIELTPGADGVSSFLHIAYADDSSGSGMDSNPDGKTYIGHAVTQTSTRPTLASAYTWSKYVGEDGAKGDKGDQGPQGIRGIDGEDGTERWIWIKYADDIDGTGLTNFPDGKDFIGVAGNKLTQAESSNPADYTWSRINDHAKLDEAITYYTEIKSGEIILGQVQDVHDRVENTEGSIQIINNSLLTKVEDETLKNTKEAIERILDGKADASELEGLSTGWVEQVNSINQFKLDYKDLETRVDNGEEINQLVTRSLTWDENWLSIGADNSSTQVQITGDRINFIDGGQVVAYITGQTLYINSATILSVLQSGNHVTSAYGTNGEITVERWSNG